MRSAGRRAWKAASGPGISGQVLTFSMDMPGLGARERRVWVYLPPDFDRTDKRYPVLYMHDGQNLFDPLTAYSGEWHVDETLEALFRSGMTEGVIVAGVDNAGESRLDEYSPWESPSGTGGGTGDRYADFLVRDLKPLIDRNLRTLPGREHTGIAGSSMGGLISLYAALKHQDVFSRVGVFSPAFWFARDAMAAFVTRTRVDLPTRIYMDVGTREGDRSREYIEDARSMSALLSRKAGLEQSFVVDEGGAHNEACWARRFPEAFLWMFQHGL